MQLLNPTVIKTLGFTAAGIKMSYRREVENLLGKECITELLNHVRGGKINDQQMKDFVLQLGELSKIDPEEPSILFGNHSRRMSRERERELDTELHDVLNDWWQTSLFQMTQSTAMEVLVRALSHPDVKCNPLASRLAKDSKLSLDLSGTF